MKINKIILSFLALCTMLVISACNEKDLALVDPGKLSPESYFKTQTQVESSVNAVYANFQTIGLFTRAWFFMYDLMGGDAAGNPQLEADKVQYWQFSFDANHGNIGDYWEACYRGINKANFVIGNADKINEIPDGQLSPELKKKYIAEARFLRALYYFLLVPRWGDIPLITEIPTSSEGFPRSPKEQVYDLIVADLQIASTDLLDKNTETVGRPNKLAASALLGKVYLYLEEYDLALAEFQKVYGQYTLADNFYDNFMDETEHTTEYIFDIEYDETLGAGNIWGGPAGTGLNEATLRGQEYGWNDWFNTYPADGLLAEYEPGDIRYEETFYTDGDIFEGDPEKRTIRTGPMPDAVPSTEIYIPLQRKAAWRKYQNYYKRLNENINSSINFKYLRYADVLLMMAECENQRSGGNQDIAAGYINEVRDRAELGPIGPGLSKEQVFDAIVHERRVELAGEQSRYSDLIRWGMAATELADQGFQAGKHELWPIPNREISSNPAITEADQNPNY